MKRWSEMTFDEKDRRLAVLEIICFALSLLAVVILLSLLAIEGS